MANRNSSIGARPSTAMAILAALISLHVAQAVAAGSAERPYNPPVGSRWIIETETNTDKVAPDGRETSLIKARAEMTIEQKTPDGFRVSYVNRGATTQGNAQALALAGSAMKALENVPIRATTDLSGKPIRVDNLDEAKAAMRSMLGNLTAPFQDKPQVVAFLNQLVSGLIEVDADKAASAYLDKLPELAKAQNTGMKPGEIRHSSTEVDSPLGGGALKSNAAFEMTEADAATGKLKFVNTASYDVASMKDFLQSVTKKLLAAAGNNSINPEQMDSLIKSMVFTLDERTVFEVEDGMTRKITETSVTTVHAMGHELSKTETQTITVTRAP
jgi:hypothetical protein